MQRIYETLFIINPDLEESEITKTIESIQDIITAGDGKILKVDKWGKRQLAYQIQKKREGYYVLLYFEASPTVLPELHHRYKLADEIMRSLVVQPKKSQVEELLASSKPSELKEASDTPSHAEQKEEEKDIEDSEAKEEPTDSSEEG